MRKILLLSMLLIPVFGLGQPSNPSIVLVSAAPSGSCSSGLPDEQTILTGALYSCQSGTWTQIGGGGGGSGTVTGQANGVIPLGTSATVIGNQSVLDQGVTNTGKVTSSEPFVAPIQDDGGAVFNVKAYGATGNGSTDDTTAINAAITALTSAGRGKLYFPQGNYLTSTCNFTLSVPTIVEGVGMSAQTNLSSYGSQVSCPSTTANLFTFTADSGLVRNISLRNTASSTPTAGAPIVADSATNSQQAIHVENVYTNGWYDGTDELVGGNFHITNSFFENFVRYGVQVTNLINEDGGGWVITGTSIAAGTRTASGSCGIYQKGAGNGHFIGNSISGGGQALTNGYCGGTDTTGQLIIAHNTMDLIVSSPINITLGVTGATITDNFLSTTGNVVPVIGNSFSSFYIGGNIMSASCTPTCPVYAIRSTVTNQLGTVGPNYSTTFLTAMTNMNNGGTFAPGNPTDMGEPQLLSFNGPSGVIYLGLGPTTTLKSAGNNPLITSNSGTSAGANWLLESGETGGSGSAFLQLQGGDSIAFTGELIQPGGSDKWRSGTSNCSSCYLIKDDAGAKVILQFPSNTMPAFSITGNANGLISGVNTSTNGDLTFSQVSTPSGVSTQTATTGGTLAASTSYCYKVSATNNDGETTATAETCQTTGSSTGTNTVTANWNLVMGATGYRIYGRTTGAELFLASVSATTQSFVDTGSGSPSGALPASNTTQALNTGTAIPAIGATSAGKIVPSTTTGTGTTVVLSASPALTGSPTAPTQATGDSSTDIANDAFIQAALNSGPALTSATTISSASFVTTGLAMPSVPISTTRHGVCHLIWEQSTGVATASFGAGMNNAPTDLWVSSRINFAAAGTQAVAYNTQTATTATIVGAAATPGATATGYYADFAFTLQTGGTNPVTLTWYGLTSNTSDALVIEPGSYCTWLP